MKKAIALTVLFLILMMVMPLCVFLDSINFNGAAKTSRFSTATSDSAEKSNKYTDKQIIEGAVAVYFDNDYSNETLKAISMLICNNYNIKKQINTEDKNTFYSEKDMKEKWGKSFNEYYNKIKTAVSSAVNQKITYKDKQVYIPFSVMSNGATATSDQYPYLSSVASPWDASASNYNKNSKECVGVSIFGVDYITKQGEDYKSALLWFLPNFEIT